MPDHLFNEKNSSWCPIWSFYNPSQSTATGRMRIVNVFILSLSSRQGPAALFMLAAVTFQCSSWCLPTPNSAGLILNASSDCFRDEIGNMKWHLCDSVIHPSQAFKCLLLHWNMRLILCCLSPIAISKLSKCQWQTSRKITICLQILLSENNTYFAKMGHF